MNERIEQLASQAKLMAEEDINKQISYNAELKAFAKKFAELIVRECIFLNMNELTHIENEILIPAYEKHFGNLYPKP